MIRGTAAAAHAVTCEAAVRSQFFRYVDCIFVGLISFCGFFRPFCPNRVHKKYSGHMIRYIPVFQPIPVNKRTG